MIKIFLILFSFVNFYSCEGNQKQLDNPKQDLRPQEISQVEIEVVKEEVKVKTDEELADVSDDYSVNKYTEASFDHTLWTYVLQKYVSDQGQVDYKGIKANASELISYLEALSRHTPDKSWSRADKLAYWINAYNAFTVKLIIDHYPVKSIKDIRSPWDKRFIKLGDNTYTLNHIEHEILRKIDEPRIHFAIVCASVSCPKLLNTAFEAEQLETQLLNATREFLADPERNHLSENHIKISKIFKWFAKDFKKDGGLIDFLNKYSDVAISENADKSYKNYDWGLNE
jgi:hypothetical protein